MKQEECLVSLELLQQLQTPQSDEEDHLMVVQEECLAHFQLLQLQTPPWLLLTPAQNALCKKPSVAGTFFFPQPFLREPTGRSFFYNPIMQAIRCNDQIVTAAQY
jgi:hypothetical protein